MPRDLRTFNSKSAGLFEAGTAGPPGELLRTGAGLFTFHSYEPVPAGCFYQPGCL